MSGEAARARVAAFFASVPEPEPEGEIEDLIRESNLAAYAEVMCFTCWCGGVVGPRAPGDDLGLGCLEDVRHEWRDSTAAALHVADAAAADTLARVWDEGAGS